MTHGILLPAAVLVLWTVIMLFWMLADRARTFKRNNVDLAKAPPGARGSDLKNMLPPGSDWPAHNYVHLMEQPTIFYAAVFILALGGFSGFDVGLAWAYVLLRVVHSVYQTTRNVVQVRAAIFAASSLVMALLSIRALLSALGLYS